MPSAMSSTPIRMRKLSARIFMLGCRLTKSPITPANTSMNPTASTIAMTMTKRWGTRPTAVMTESSEKTMSRRMIWPSVHATVARPGKLLGRVALEPLIDLVAGLGQQEQPTSDQDEVPAGETLAQNEEERRAQPHHPGDAEEQTQAHDEREDETDPSGAGLLRRWQPADEERDEHDVVDAQHDLHEGKGGQADERGGLQQHLEHLALLFQLLLEPRNGERKEQGAQQGHRDDLSPQMLQPHTFEDQAPDDHQEVGDRQPQPEPLEELRHPLPRKHE